MHLAGSQRIHNEASHRVKPRIPAISARHVDTFLNLRIITLLNRSLDLSGKRIGIIRNGDDVTMRMIKTLDFRETSRHDGYAHGQILVQLCRIHIGRVVTERVRDNADVKRFNVTGKLVMRTGT
jgi:hypothetical protein